MPSGFHCTCPGWYTQHQPGIQLLHRDIQRAESRGVIQGQVAALDAQAGEVLLGGGGDLLHADQGGQGSTECLEQLFLVLHNQALGSLGALGSLADQDARLLQQVLGVQ